MSHTFSGEKNGKQFRFTFHKENISDARLEFGEMCREIENYNETRVEISQGIFDRTYFLDAFAQSCSEGEECGAVDITKIQVEKLKQDASSLRRFFYENMSCYDMTLADGVKISEFGLDVIVSKNGVEMSFAQFIENANSDTE